MNNQPTTYIRLGRGSRKNIVPIEQYIEQRSIKIPECGCWIWMGDVYEDGYGSVRWTINKTVKRRLAHRASYEVFVGPIPDGMEIDHLCFVPGCVNPSHLEAVTARENRRRSRRGSSQTCCKRGHTFSTENTYLYKGVRICKACNAIRSREYKLRKGNEQS